MVPQSLRHRLFHIKEYCSFRSINTIYDELKEPFSFPFCLQNCTGHNTRSKSSINLFKCFNSLLLCFVFHVAYVSTVQAGGLLAQRRNKRNKSSPRVMQHRSNGSAICSKILIKRESFVKNRKHKMLSGVSC